MCFQHLIFSFWGWKMKDRLSHLAFLPHLPTSCSSWWITCGTSLLVETRIISLFPLNSSSSFSLIFFPRVKYSLISCVTSLFSLNYPSLLRPPNLWGLLFSFCLSDWGRFPSETAEAFFSSSPQLCVCVLLYQYLP